MSESKFKVGDDVVRTGGSTFIVKTGDVHKVAGTSSCGGIKLEGICGIYNEDDFELDTSSYHVHHDEIITWAKGAKIEYQSDTVAWYLTKRPTWGEQRKYRVYEEPVTSPRELEMERIQAEMRNLADALEALKESK